LPFIEKTIVRSSKGKNKNFKLENSLSIFFLFKDAFFNDRLTNIAQVNIFINNKNLTFSIVLLILKFLNVTSISENTKDDIISQLSQTNNYLTKNSSMKTIENVTKVVDKTVEVLKNVQGSGSYDAGDVQNSMEIINSILNFPDEVFNDRKATSIK